MSSHDDPKVLWVVPVPNFGGVARHTLDMARAGIPGYNLVVLAPAGPLTARLKEAGVLVLEAEFGPGHGFKTSYASLARAVLSEKPAIVHSHLAYADIVAAAVVNWLKVRRITNRRLTVPKLFTTEHGIAADSALYHGTSWRARIMQIAHRVRLRGTDTAIAVSRSTAEQMRRVWGAGTVELIYNGVDIAEVRADVASRRAAATPAGADAPRILSLARLSPEKGIDALIDAFAQLKKNHPKARLEIAGEGDIAPDLRQQVEHLNLADSVEFSGFVDPRQALGRNDMVVQLSAWENCSYTLLDAKAAGLKVVATAVGGNPEILTDAELVARETQHLQQHVLDRMVEQLGSKDTPEFTWSSTAEMAHHTAALYEQKLPQGIRS